MYGDDEEEDELRPPPPLRINTLAYPNSSPASSTKGRKTADSNNSSNNNNNNNNNMNTLRTLKRENISRKPAPTSSVFSLSAKSSLEAIRGQHGRERSTTPEREHVSMLKSRGFGLGNVVKEKVASRRKPVDIAPAMDPLNASSPIAAVKPPNFVSIDDWLDSREREGLHRRSNTVTTVASQTTRHGGPLRLHLRQSTFAPLPTPHELAPAESIPQLPMIPQQYTQAVPKTYIPSPSPISSRPPSPPRASSRADQPPRDHIEQLEYEQEQLEARRSSIKREMWDLGQLLPPNPSTHNPIAREGMNKRLGELVSGLADVEKEIHEMGMKLHRAWRRRDKDMGSEGPTHLWVSRVRDGN